MKTIVIALLAVILLSSITFAQWIQTSGPSGGLVSQLVTNPTNAYVFANVNGDVYRSTDAGATWTPQTNSLQGNINSSVITASGTSVYLGVTSGNTPNILFRSTDNGDTWAVATATGIPAFYYPGAMIVSGSKLLMYGSYLLGGGKMFASTDGGENFTESTTGLPANFLAGYIAMKGSAIYAASFLTSAVKGVYKSTDNGVNWAPDGTTFMGAAQINGITTNSVGVFVSTNLNGVFRSNGNDTVWTKINPNSSTNFATGIMATATNLFIGIGGLMYRADQNGNTWDSVRTGLPPANAGTSIGAIAASGSSVMCGYAKHGIYRSTNNGTNWFQSHNGLKALKIDGIHASNGLLFAAGDQYGFFRSADHGDSWLEINNGVAATAGWFCFARVGSDMLAGSGSSLLYRSSDNGDNWTLSNTGFALTNSFAFFVEGNTVYTTGLPGVSKSTDGGLNWTTLPAGYLGYEGGLDVWKDGSNIVTGSNVNKHRSTDDGASWSTTLTGLPAGGISAFTQIDSTLFAASPYGVYKSADHGASWTVTASLPSTVAAQSLTARGGDLFVGTNDGVYRSTDKGGTWIPINDGWSAKMLVYKITYDDQYLYAGTTNHSVWRRPLAGITGVKEISHFIPRNFALSQNYPNPFNPTTRMSFAIRHSSLVTLKVYDVLGREVTTLVNEEIQPGTYQATWDASGQPSGVYYYRLQAGAYVEMKTMVLMK